MFRLILCASKRGLAVGSEVRQDQLLRPAVLRTLESSSTFPILLVLLSRGGGIRIGLAPLESASTAVRSGLYRSIRLRLRRQHCFVLRPRTLFPPLPNRSDSARDSCIRPRSASGRRPDHLGSSREPFPRCLGFRRDRCRRKPPPSPAKGFDAQNRRRNKSRLRCLFCIH